MAWTDSCKIEAVAQIKKKAESTSIRDAIKKLSEESGIPIGTLKRWYWPDGQETYQESIKNETINLPQSSLIKHYEQQEIDKDAEAQVLQQASKVRKAKKQKQTAVNEERKEEIKSQPIPIEKYHTIVIDPPWPVQKIIRDDRPNQDVFEYPTMSIEEMTNFDINQFADDNCHIYLWSTHKFLPIAFLILDSWGFRYQCLLTWVKNVGMTPFSWMYSTEHVLFGRKGSLDLLKMGVRLDFTGKVREHSRKPEIFYEIVRKVSPSPRIDIFSREKREGFDQYGNEQQKFQLEDRQEMVGQVST